MKHKKQQIKIPAATTAAIYAFYVNVLIYLLFLVTFIYGRNAVIPYEEHHPQPPRPDNWMFLFLVLITYLYIFILFCINFFILKQERYSNPILVFSSVLISLLFIIIWNRLVLLIQNSVFDLAPLDSKAARGMFMRDFILGTLTVFSSQIMFLNYRKQLIAIENETLKAEYERARYELLKNQMDPHFLFNTLNTLNSVIDTSPQKAQEYVQKLSSIFRYTIQDKAETTLAEELAFTKDYCDLMKIRYGGNLRFIFNISEKYNSYFIVPFSIQTLVENAIKHNVITNQQPLIVSISTDLDNECAVVSNLVNLKKEKDIGEGVGLVNLSERYRLKWGKDIIIQCEEQIFTVQLPLIFESKNKN